MNSADVGISCAFGSCHCAHSWGFGAGGTFPPERATNVARSSSLSSPGGHADASVAIATRAGAVATGDFVVFLAGMVGREGQTDFEENLIATCATCPYEVIFGCGRGTAVPLLLINWVVCEKYLGAKPKCFF